MLGYYNDPEETAKVITEDGWLRTGDYGYIDKDGFVYVTGRKKNVIVTKNGKNIFPEEVEYYLMKSPLVSEVVVWGKDDEKSGDTIICADVYPDKAYVKEAHGDVTDAELRNLLDADVDKANDGMPAYKRVKRFTVRKEEFEKTTTQKIKRHTVAHTQE
jgi:long-chain acyl-CoA synthetase